MKPTFLSFTLSAFLGVAIFSSHASQNPDWSAGAKISTPRSNPYGLGPEALQETIYKGKIHSLNYPIEVSGTIAPWNAIRSFLDERQPDPLKALLKTIFGGVWKIKSTDDLFGWLGLHPYPKNSSEGDIPYPGSTPPKLRMGASTFKFHGADVLTFSCATCHSGQIFGKKILGLTNRFPNANEFFLQGKRVTKIVSPLVFNLTMNPTREEAEVYKRLKERARAVESKTPASNGLDASLSQVALSLSRRNQDSWATFSDEYEKRPREELLRSFVADSKPAVWWNVKYKNRWLSDGSVLSGNPIYTNFIWNELGRGTDLEELTTFLKQNLSMIEELTTAVFSTEAPRITDFFEADKINIEKAKRGEALFVQMCSKCHGTYEKNWSLPHSNDLPLIDKLKTASVRYPEQTPVKDVGTDPNRYIGMKSLADGLNPLAISKELGVVIETQKGYVPPPLVGIWVRFPYFHNNSIPNLCELLTPAPLRSKKYFSGEVLDREKDFDWECVGYPVGSNTPKNWKVDGQLFDTTRDGLSNRGHDDRIFIKDGVYLLEGEKRGELIEFLKTL